MELNWNYRKFVMIDSRWTGPATKMNGRKIDVNVVTVGATCLFRLGRADLLDDGLRLEVYLDDFSFTGAAHPKVIARIEDHPTHLAVLDERTL